RGAAGSRVACSESPPTVPSFVRAVALKEAMSIESRCRGALLGCLLGDAFGRPLEGMAISDPRLQGLIDARRNTVFPWGYSDDSQMMMSVGESLLARGFADPQHLIHTLADNYDPARGYGKGMKLIVEALRGGEGWDKVARSVWTTGSRGNGAAVRIAPLACFFHADEEQLVAATRMSAAITHADPLAIDGAVLMARAIALAVAHDATSFDA